MNGQQRFQIITWLPILTMDVAAPFHALMGVPVSKAYFALELRPILDRCYLDRSGVLDADELARRFVDSLSGQEAGGVEAFGAWLRTTATIGWNDRPGWAPWAHILNRWAARGMPGSVGRAPWARTFLEAFQEEVNMRPLRAQAEALRSGPLSAWDAGMFARHHFYVIDEAEDGSDPFIPVLNTIEFARIAQFQATIWASLDSSQAKVLTEAARATAEQMGLSNPSRVPPFDQLQDLPC